MDKETRLALVEAQAKENANIRKGLQNAYVDAELGALKEALGVDLKDQKTFPLTPSGAGRLSLKKLAEGCRKLAIKTREAVSENTLGMVLRGAVLTLANQWYDLVPPEHEKVFLTQPSDSAIELYPIVQRAGLMRRAERMAVPAQIDIQGIDQFMRNWRFLGKCEIERALVEDDKVGIVLQRVQELGQNPQYVEDAWAFTKFIGAAGTVPGSNDQIPASETQPAFETNGWPWSTALKGGGVNRLAAYAAVSEGNLQQLDLLLMNMVDILGNKMLVQPTHVLGGTSLKFILRQLLESANYVSTVPMNVAGNGASTSVGTTFSENVMKGLYTPFISRFLPATSYSLIEAMKGFIFQRRTANEIVQQDPNDGESLDKDAYIYRIRARWNTDWLDPRFAARGN